jgi:DNA invertase Pin-like site-specific DNA recombinase
LKQVHVSGPREEASALIPVAEYVRMSTDLQKYSIANQSDAIRLYAAMHGMAIVRTYADKGKSGLSFDRRDALKKLIEDVQSGETDFKAILVYDVSRWGRFQDSDESGYYEFLCKRAGIKVNYCAEQFENDGSPISAIIKSIKRAMAGEYSRELSIKTFAGQSRSARSGFRAGGQAGYALRRMLIDANGAPKGILQIRELKSIAADRVVLVPGPQDEITTLRWIFLAFVRRRMSANEIADTLNKKGKTTHLGSRWTHHAIYYILRSEKYIGNNVWNRNSFKLKQIRVRNRHEDWVRFDGAFEPIVEPALFQAAQEILNKRETTRRRLHYFTDEKLLRDLRQLLRDHGGLSWKIIQDNRGGACVRTYREHFGTLAKAFERIGFVHVRKPPVRQRKYSDEALLDALRRLLRRRGALSAAIIDKSKGIAASSTYRARLGKMTDVYKRIGFAPKRLPNRNVAPGLSDEEVLNLLRRAWKQHGRLSRSIIDKTSYVPCHGTFHERFGGLIPAYKLIGYGGEDGRQRLHSP